MSRLLTKSLKQSAVYWSTPVASGYGGYSFSDPVELDVRWEERQELFINVQGKEERSQAVVYLDQDVDIGGYLYLGELDDFDSSDPDPQNVSDAKEIRAFQKIPNIKATSFLRKVWL